MSSRAFWELVDRLEIPDETALDLIGYPGRLPPSGKRPRFRLTTRQTRLAAYLLEIEPALHAIGQTPQWLKRKIRTAPFSGRTPLDLMVAGSEEGNADVLQHLTKALMRKSLQ